MGFKIVRSATAEQELAGYKIFGHSVPREDAYKKATAKDQFADDIQFPHMLHSVILHSPYAHARIKNIDTSKAEQLPGVAGVVTYKDVFEWEKAGQVHQVAPTYVLHDRVMFVGNPVAIVAAEDFCIAEQARDLIEIEYEELPFYLSPEESIADGAMLLHPNVRDNTNVWGTQQISPDIFGSEATVDAELANSDVIVETEYREPAIKHMFLEHHTCVAQWRGNELFVWFSSQGVRQNWTLWPASSICHRPR
jgi:CO/xanthine dehydrogenase Mo-binding subunit